MGSAIAIIYLSESIKETRRRSLSGLLDIIKSGNRKSEQVRESRKRDVTLLAEKNVIGKP
ncbi:MAG: hypothetical protein DME69_01145 [Verrucomicrobia bacterium]|nr:MAG: hypothetical protein DME69_01145 [Verrucomicrobiota bacterium]